MEENRKTKIVLYLLPELGCMALTAMGILGLCRFGIAEQSEYKMMCCMVLTMLGIGIVGFSLRAGIVRGELDYDNRNHIMRFWLCFLGSLCTAFACALLPAAAWPFLPVFVVLALFSNLETGVLAGTALIAIPVCLAQSSVEVFLMYLVSGIFGATLFQRLKNGFRTGPPIALSLACLLACLTAGTVLTVNARLGFEYFVVPMANLLVSGILLFGILKYFFSKIVYLNRDRYLDLNDTENAILSELKQKDRDAYMRGVHTAYFCERIAVKLGMNADALKCAAYYHSMEGELSALAEQYSFPPDVVRILEDYRNVSKGIRHRETAVLLASDNVIDAVLALQAQDSGIPVEYEREIDGVFRGYYEKGVFDKCDISVQELQILKRTFKEEKLYYDFLR